MRSPSSPSSTFFRALLRDNVASSRSDTTILRSLPSSSSNSSSRRTIRSGNDMPLAQQLASQLIDIPLRSSSASSNNNTEDNTKNTAIRASFAIAGGGSKALSALASTPGASSTLIDASLLYDRRSFLSFISDHPLPPASMLPSYSSSGSSIPKDTNSNSEADDNTDAGGSKQQRRAKFNFVSDEAASLLSNSALHQALLSSHSLSQTNQVVGVGCTSTLVSIPKKRDKGREERKSRAHLSLSFPDGLVRSYSLIMGTGIGEEITGKVGLGNEEIVKRRRTRAEEEEVLGNFILWTLIQEQERRCSIADAEANDNLRSESNINDGDGVDKSDVFDSGVLNSEQGDVLVMREWSCSTTHPGIRISSPNKNDMNQDMESILQQKAQEIINGGDTTNNSNNSKVEPVQTDAVVLVPGISSMGNSGEGGTNDNIKTQMMPLVHTVLPPNPIIFPGSFNPPHVGHIALARAAVKAMTEKHMVELDEWFQDEEGEDDDDLDENENEEELLETIWNTMEHQSMVKRRQQHQSGDSPFSILFEMSLTNADKPPMKASEATRRVALFAKYYDTKNHFHSDNNDGDGEEAIVADNSAMPPDWGVLLTSAPLFLDKVRLLKKYLVQKSPPPSLDMNSHHLSIPTNKTKLRKGRDRILTFAIGTDTMVRILNPKYYNQDREQMLNAVREMRREGVHFVVGGRVEQIKSQEGDGNMEGQTRFVTGEDDLVDLPPDVREMFTIVQEKDFRLDISSSELRARENV